MSRSRCIQCRAACNTRDHWCVFQTIPGNCPQVMIKVIKLFQPRFWMLNGPSVKSFQLLHPEDINNFIFRSVTPHLSLFSKSIFPKLAEVFQYDFVPVKTTANGLFCRTSGGFVTMTEQSTNSQRVWGDFSVLCRLDFANTRMKWLNFGDAVKKTDAASEALSVLAASVVQGLAVHAGCLLSGWSHVWFVWPWGCFLFSDVFGMTSSSADFTCYTN